MSSVPAIRLKIPDSEWPAHCSFLLRASNPQAVVGEVVVGIQIHGSLEMLPALVPTFLFHGLTSLLELLARAVRNLQANGRHTAHSFCGGCLPLRLAPDTEILGLVVRRGNDFEVSFIGVNVIARDANAMRLGNG